VRDIRLGVSQGLGVPRTPRCGDPEVVFGERVWNAFGTVGIKPSLRITAEDHTGHTYRIEGSIRTSVPDEVKFASNIEDDLCAGLTVNAMAMDMKGD